MRLIDAEPIERELFKRADKSLAKNPYENAKICAFRRAFELVLNAPTIAPPPNDPLTLSELQEMDGEPIWIDNGYGRNKCYIVNNRYEIHGDVEPCGVDMWGAGTSLSLLVRCGVYRRPPNKEESV